MGGLALKGVPQIPMKDVRVPTSPLPKKSSDFYYTFSAVKVKSTTDTSGVGTRKAIPAAFQGFAGERIQRIQPNNTDDGMVVEPTQLKNIDQKGFIFPKYLEDHPI